MSKRKSAKGTPQGGLRKRVGTPVRPPLAETARGSAHEHRQTDVALRESEAKFRKLHESMQDAFVSVDMQGRILECNSAYQEMLGYTADELRKRTYLDLTPKKWHAMESRIVQEQVLPQGYSGVYEKEYRRKDGTVFPVELRTFLIRDASEQPSTMWAIVRDVTARKETEAALERLNATLAREVEKRTAALCESERTAHAVVDGLTSHIAIVDAGGRILAVNARWREFAEENGGSFIAVGEGANYLAVCDGAARNNGCAAEEVAAGIRKVLKGKSPEFSTEYPCHSPTEQRWFIVRVTPFPGEGPRRALVSHENITTRVLAEQALIREHEFSERVIHTVRTIVLLLSPEGKIVRFNRHFEELSGWSFDEVQGRDWFDTFLPARDRGRIRKLFRRGLRGPRTHSNINPIVTKDGRELEIEWDGAPLKDADGRLVGLLCSGRDITERRRAEAALRDREERLRTILNTVTDAIITIDRRGRITGVNPATERMFGYSESEMVGQNVSLLMPSPYREEHDQYLENYERTGQAKIIGIGREVQAMRKDGSIFPIELAVSEVDHLHLFTGVIRDITERKRLEAEVLRIVEEERMRVAADLHDGICQELVGIQFVTNGLRQDLEKAGHPLAPRARRIEEAIGAAALRTRQTARGMNPVVADGSGLMHALRGLAERTRLRGVHCAFQCPVPVAIENQTTASELYRIAQEAVQNAVCHSHAKRITVRLSESGSEACLVVTDNGCGLPADVAGAPGMGLRVMRYRAGVIGGQFMIQSRKPTGTAIICRVPKKHL